MQGTTGWPAVGWYARVEVGGRGRVLIPLVGWLYRPHHEFAVVGVYICPVSGQPTLTSENADFVEFVYNENRGYRGAGGGVE